MRARRQRISNYSIQWENERHKDRIASMRELLDKIDTDPQKKDRIKKCECKICFYQTGGRIGGAAMTDRECAFCGEVMHFGSTATNKMCQGCATKAGLCKICGADINYVNKRKRELPEVKVCQ